jgi:sodium/bile acid cotransporter 3/5
VFAKIFRQPAPDAIAIAVETGIQNTGIAIFLLTFSLDQPMADLTTVVPVSVAIMTPFPLLAIYLIQKCMNL